MPPGGKPVTFAAMYQPTDAGQAILESAKQDGRAVWVKLKRPWRVRLFSWPWRPWNAYYGEAVPMLVTQERLVDAGDEEMEVYFTLTLYPE